jgi:hypothetical protein
MNTLIYNARMALRDFMEVNIYTQGNDVVYLTVFPNLVWEGALETRADEVIRNIIARLHDMDLDVVGGDKAIDILRDSKPVEIIRKAA